MNYTFRHIISLLLIFCLLLTDIPPLLQGAEFLAVPSSPDELFIEKSLLSSDAEQVETIPQLSRRELLKKSALLAGILSSLAQGETQSASSTMSIKRKQEENYRSVLRATNIVLDTVYPNAPKDFRDKLFYLLLAYARHESLDFLYRKQIKGPARGLWQVEPATALDMIKKLIKSNQKTSEVEFEQTVKEIEYTVKRGDNLEKIAEKFNDAVYNIVERNENITNPNDIRAGDTISIMKATVKTTPYKVVSGDAFEKIAKRFYGDRKKWQIIAKFNGLDTDGIYVNQVLGIPHLKESSAPKTPTLLDKIASAAGFTTAEQMLKKCKNKSDIGSLLMTNDVFCCFIACTVITSRAEGKIRKLPGRKTIEKELARKLQRRPTTKEVEEEFARKVSLIWLEEYNRSTKNVERKKRQFVERAMDPNYSRVLVSHIPPLHVRFDNPHVSPVGTVYIDKSDRRWLFSLGGASIIVLYIAFVLKKGLRINWVIEEHTDIAALRAQKASHPRSRTRKAIPHSL